MKSIIIAILTVFVVLTGIVNAENLYAVTFNNELLSINSNTGAGTLIGNLDTSMAAFGLADKGDKLYTFDQISNRIKRLDPATANTLATIDVGIVHTGEGAISFRSDGKGFLAGSDGETGKLWSFNIDTSSSTEIASLRSGIDGLDFDGNDALYGLGQFDHNLYTINQTNGVLSLIGSTGIDNVNNLGGLTFTSQGTLFAVLNDSLYTLNKNTGAASLVGAIGYSQVSGLTAMVPEPATMLLISIGGLMAVRRRK